MKRKEGSKGKKRTEQETGKDGEERERTGKDAGKQRMGQKLAARSPWLETQQARLIAKVGFEAAENRPSKIGLPPYPRTLGQKKSMVAGVEEHELYLRDLY